MKNFLAQFIVLAAVGATCLLGPAVAVFFMARRKRLMRQQRRSPLPSPLLRSPGHSLREQLDEVRMDSAFGLLMLTMVSLMTLSLFLAQSHMQGLSNMMLIAPVYVLGVLGYMFFAILRLVKASTRIDKLKAGFDGELAVGQELDQLMRQGAATFHDIPAENFNIDHVVIAAEGVFAIETKGFTKSKKDTPRTAARVAFDGKALKFTHWTTSAPLEQAQRQAAWLANWLSSAVGTPVHVQAVLALPGWFVERTGRSAVQVLSGKELANLLKFCRAKPLSEQDVKRIAYQVEQRCRTVVPRFSEERRVT